MREALFQQFRAVVPDNLDRLRGAIKPNLPWADDHFKERVSGWPLNPGETWKNWPWALAADKHRTEGECFSHTYMERFWAAKTDGHGIRYPYGDLGSLVELLRREPNTRQAYLPVFFPEDTGAIHGGRIPCTLGYHFIQRGGYLHMSYYIRSCDLYRHFRDDVYLAAKLLLWVRDQVNPNWTPGWLRMDIGSLHCFVNDYWRL